MGAVTSHCGHPAPQSHRLRERSSSRAEESGRVCRAGAGIHSLPVGSPPAWRPLGAETGARRCPPPADAVSQPSCRREWDIGAGRGAEGSPAVLSTGSGGRGSPVSHAPRPPSGLWAPPPVVRPRPPARGSRYKSCCCLLEQGTLRSLLWVVVDGHREEGGGAEGHGQGTHGDPGVHPAGRTLSSCPSPMGAGGLAWGCRV